MILNKVINVAAIALIATPASLLMSSASFAAPTGTSFECKKLVNDPSGSPFATLAIRPDGSTSAPLLRWRTEQFSNAGYTPERRCYEVTNRLNIAVKEVGGRMSSLWLTLGEIGDNTVICYVNKPSYGCNSRNTLWTLNADNERDPAQVLAKVSEFIVTKGSGSGIQETAGQPYVSLDQFVDAAFSAGTPPSSTPSTKPTQPFNMPTTQPIPSQGGDI